MLNRTKFYAGITLLVQSVSFLAMFIMLCRKKKSIANVCLAVAAAGGVAGALLLFLDSRDELKRRKIIAARDACCSDYPDEFFDFSEPDTEDDYDGGEVLPF